jgi:threonine aldolase
MHFASDNWAGAAPQIVEAVAREAGRFGKAYGDSDIDHAVAARFAEIFEHEVAVFFVATGSAANGLSMTALNRPGGMVFCHRDSHLFEGECGAVEYLTGGARLIGIDGADGRMDVAALKRAMAGLTPGPDHVGQGMAVSVTQQTEAGTLYPLDTIREIASIARAAGLPLHMDGARFANALVRTNVSPAEMTWRAGVDVMSFGATKNGCIAAEAVVFFNTGLARDMAYVRKRAGHVFSKARFVAAQFDAYLSDGLWLGLARHANAMADRLREGIGTSTRAREAWATSGNEIFVALQAREAERLRAAGAVFHDWDRAGSAKLGAGEQVIRLVTAFSTQEAEVDAFLHALG